MRKRSQTAIFNKFSQTQRFGFGGIGNIKALQTPQNMAQTTRMKDNKSKDLSIFQHFTISKAYDEEREKSYVPDPAPIDINQEECSLIENDLKKYLESGQKLDDYNDQPFIINAAFDENKGPTYYIEGTQGNWEKIKGDLSENDKQRDPLLKSGQGTVYAQPKPNYKERSDIPERLIKIKIDREIDKAQFNTLSKLIDLSEFKRMKPRAPRDLVNKIFQPISVDRKPFIVKKWISPFDNFKENKKNKARAKR